MAENPSRTIAALGDVGGIRIIPQNPESVMEACRKNFAGYLTKNKDVPRVSRSVRDLRLLRFRY